MWNVLRDCDRTDFLEERYRPKEEMAARQREVRLMADTKCYYYSRSFTSPAVKPAAEWTAEYDKLCVNVISKEKWHGNHPLWPTVSKWAKWPWSLRTKRPKQTRGCTICHHNTIHSPVCGQTTEKTPPALRLCLFFTTTSFKTALYQIYGLGVRSISKWLLISLKMLINTVNWINYKHWSILYSPNFD